MRKTAFKLLVLAAVLITESSCQEFKVIRPIYRSPPRGPPIIRHVREAPNGEPLWLYNGDIPRAPATGEHPVLPKYIDDINMDPNRRYARSLDFLRRHRHGQGHEDWHGGPMIPGPNTRYPRDIRLPFDPLPRPQRPFDPFSPFPNPRPRPLYPIYARIVRDLHQDEDFDESSYE